MNQEINLFTQSTDEIVLQILNNYGLAFTIEKLPSFATREGMVIDENGRVSKSTEKILTPYYMLYNDMTGEIINSCSKGYTVTQNKDILTYMINGIKRLFNQPNFDKRLIQNLRVSKAGSINGGRKVFLQLEINGYGYVNGDRIKRYVTLIDSNDGSTSLSVGIGNLTMSCQNQFYQFYKSGQSKFKHTARLTREATIDNNTVNLLELEIGKLVETELKRSFQIVDIFNDFAKVKVTESDIENAMKRVYGYNNSDEKTAPTRVKNVLKTLNENIKHQLDDKGYNVWGLHSGFTRWTTHARKSPDRKHGKIESLMLTSNYKINDASFNFAKELLASAN